MEIPKRKSENLTLALLVILGWFALVAQFILQINSNLATRPELMIRFFSYFTILTNLLVAVCCTFLLLGGHSNWHIRFSNAKTKTAVAVYILVVGLIYNIVLRDIWKPEGLQLVVNELLHSVIPVLYILYWFLFVPKNQLEWRDFMPWLIYPLVYVAFILTRGTFSGFYPYPFMDVGKLGATAVCINSVGVAALFLVFSLLFIAVGKFSKKEI